MDWWFGAVAVTSWVGVAGIRWWCGGTKRNLSWAELYCLLVPQSAIQWKLKLLLSWRPSVYYIIPPTKNEPPPASTYWATQQEKNSRGMLPSLREVSCLDGDGVGVVTRTKPLSDSDDSDLNTTISPRRDSSSASSIPFNRADTHHRLLLGYTIQTRPKIHNEGALLKFDLHSVLIEKRWLAMICVKFALLYFGPEEYVTGYWANTEWWGPVCGSRWWWCWEFVVIQLTITIMTIIFEMCEGGWGTNRIN